MKVLSTLLPVLASMRLVSAHSTVFAAWINDVDQGVGNVAGGYIRSPPNNSPILDVTSSDMTCNINGKNAVTRTLTVKPGDKFTFEWHHNNRDPGDDIIDGSHKGPVLVYIAPTAAGTAGNSWVKIYEDGFDPSTQTFAVTRLISNKGLHSVIIPNIAAGDYLLRAEIIALHEGNRRGGAQFYMECVQIRIAQTGGVALPAGVSIPGVYSADDPGILFDLYSQPVTSYPIPGPRALTAIGSGVSITPTPTPTPSSGSSPSSSSTVKPTTTVTTGGTQSTFITSTIRASTTTTTISSQPTTAIPSQPTLTSTTGKAATTPSVVPTSASSSTPAPTPDSCQGGDVGQWQQCGGINFSGPTRCKNGLICKEWNPYYFQCIFP